MDDSLLNFVLRMFAEHVITLTDAVVRAKEVNCTEKKKRKTRKKEKKKTTKKRKRNKAWAAVCCENGWGEGREMRCYGRGLTKAH